MERKARLVNDIIPQKGSISRKVVRNTIYNAIGHFWGIIVALGLIPYIIGHIGVERYGVWAIIGVLTGYFGLLDCGIGTSFVKYIAEYYTKKDYKSINQVVNTGLIFYLSFAVLVITLALFIINPLLSFFKTPQALHSEAVFVLLFGIILFAVSNALSVFGSIQGGLQRMDISNKLAIAISIPNIIGTVFFLECGYGLSGLMINNAILLVIRSVVNIITAFKILPELRFSPLLFRKKMFKKLLIYGYKLQITRISGMVSQHADKLLIAYFLSLGYVTFYQLGSSVVDRVKSIPLLLTTAILPALSEVNAKGESGKLIDAYTRGTRYLSMVAFPLFSFLIISAPYIMMVWMGKGYEKSAWVIQILAVSWLFNVLIGVGCSLVQAIGKPEIQMRSSLANTILNLILSIILIMKFGFFGVVIGTSLSVFLSTGYFFIGLHRELKLPKTYFLKRVILDTLVICICIGLPVWGLSFVIQGIFTDMNRITSLTILLIQGILFFGFYLILLLYKKPFDEMDIEFLNNKVPFIGLFQAKKSKLEA